MRLWLLILATAVVLAVQVGFLAALKPFGVVPSLLLVFLVTASLRGSVGSTMVVAGLAGLVVDSASGAYFGLWTLLLPGAVLATKLIQRSGVVTHDVWVALTVVAVATLLAAGVVITGMVGLITQWPVGLLAGRVGLEVALNVALAAAVWPLTRWLTRPTDSLASVR